MSTDAWLDGLRRTAYLKLGRQLPDFSEATRQVAANDEVLAPGGPLELSLRQELIKHGMPEATAATRAAEHTRQLRRNAAQLTAHGPSPQRLAATIAASPPGVSPYHTLILQGLREDLYATANPPHSGSLVEQWRTLRDRVVFTTLPTGEINARALRLPKDAGYVVAFEPAFFDLFYNLSNAFADTIDIPKAQALAQRYASGDDSAKAIDAIRWGDTAPVVAVFDTFEAFAFWGLPPPNLPGYRTESFELAEHMRRSCTLFVGAHEVAHLLLGHLDAAATSSAMSREQEMQADRLGWLMADAAMAAHEVNPRARIMGAALFLITAVMIELTRAIGRGEQPSSLIAHMQRASAEATGTHPPSLLRLARLVELVTERQPPPLALVSEFLVGLLVDVGEQFWLRIGPDLRSRYERGARARPHWEGWDALTSAPVGWNDAQ